MTDQLKQAINAAQSAQNHTEKAAKTEQAEAIRLASSSAGEQSFDMSESTYKTSHTAVRKARRFAMQGLYEWLVTDRRFDTSGKLGWKDNAPHDIAARTRATNAMHTVHIGYYHEMMRDIPEQIEALDALITQHLDREIDKLDTVEHAILLIGAYELQNRLEIPYKVVMDEAMKLNNHFGATDAHKLINAVLDRMAIELRSVEVEADTKANKRNSQKPAITQTSANKIEQAVETETADTSTASTKPRISANKAGVKRKPSTSTAKAAIANANAKTDNAKPAAFVEEPIVEKSSTIVADETINVNNIENLNTLNNLDTLDNAATLDSLDTANIVGASVTESMAEAQDSIANDDTASTDLESKNLDSTDLDSTNLESTANKDND